MVLLPACAEKTAQNSLEPQLFEAPDASVEGDAAQPPSEIFIADDQGPTSEARDPSLGGRCLDDAQCDDGLPCTFDSCDAELERCRFEPDDSACQDDSYCNGREVCTPGAGCKRGEPVSCDDQDACTIDRCVEETRDCERRLRDVDDDGDPDVHCGSAAGDCNDQDPNVSSEHVEVCDNRRDDDCDGSVDEAECERAEYDLCEEPLRVSASTTLFLDLSAAVVDTAAACSPPGAPDLFIAIEAEGEDVLVSATGPKPSFAMANIAGCATATGDAPCVAAVPVDSDLAAAQLLLRNVDELAYVALFDADDDPLEVNIEYLPASNAPDNETCDSPAPLSPGQLEEVDLYAARPDQVTACAEGIGDVVYEFSVDEESDLRVFANPTDPYSQSRVSLRTAACEELACTEVAGAELFARALPAGSYLISVSSNLPSTVELLALVEPSSPPPLGDNCSEPRPLELGELTELDLKGFSDTLTSSCQPSGRDAVFNLTLDEKSDVLIKGRLSVGDRAAVALLRSGCDVEAPLACTSGSIPPLRAVAHALPAGDYRVVAESEQGAPMQLLALSRPARPPSLVVGADNCDDPFVVPSSGGFFTGNTTGHQKDFTASCDVANAGPDGAPDQLLQLTLDEPSFVVIDSVGSNYRTVINLRQGPECPGTEVPRGCAAAPDETEYIEALLDAGTYFIQVDGYASGEGLWNLDIFVTPQSELQLD